MKYLAALFVILVGALFVLAKNLFLTGNQVATIGTIITVLFVASLIIINRKNSNTSGDH